MPTQKDFEDNNYEIPIDLYILIFHNWNNVIEATCNLFYKNYKLCYKCRKLFPSNNTYFNKNENTDDKLEHWCITCEENKKADERKRKLVKLHQFHKENKTIKYSIKEIILTNEKNKLKIQIDENNLLKEQIETLKEQVKILEMGIKDDIKNELLLKNNEKQLFKSIKEFYDENNHFPTKEEFKNYKIDININLHIKQFGTWNNILIAGKDKLHINYKLCPHCGRFLPPDVIFFGKDKSTNDGFQCWCKECKSKERKNRYKVDKKTGKSKEYYEDNRLRHIASAFTKRGFPNITEKDFQEIIDNFKNKDGTLVCPYCGREVQDERDVQFDHFIPYWIKQKNIPLTNLIPVCKYCNRSKWDDDFHEWYKRQNFYDIDREKKLLKYTKNKILQSFYT